MKLFLRIVSYASLALLLLAPCLYLAGSIQKPLLHGLLLAATIGWFVTAPFSMGRERQKEGA